MRVDESVLPGVGRKFTITTQSGDRLVVVVHHSGRREVQTYEGPDADEPLYALDLTDEEARELGAILGGVLFHPEAVARRHTRLQNHTIEWLEVYGNLAGKRVGDLPLPAQAYLLALLRDGEALIPHPDPGLALHVGDTLVVAGSREGVDALKQKL